jgi:hypothetical protein
MNDEKKAGNYNGWTNYETWAVKLWFDNEEFSYRNWMERARSWKGREDDASQFAEELEESVREGNPLADRPSLYSDLLSTALSEVDWFEIAESYLEDVEPDADQSDSTEEDESCDGQAIPQPTQPAPLDAENLFGEVIFAYTRKQALADGVLRDVTETAKEAGFKVPVALTQAVWAEYVLVPEGVESQDEKARLWDILSMCRYGIALGSSYKSKVLFKLHVRNDNREGVPPLVELKAVCGPNDDGSPCITIMNPDED